MVVLLHGIGGAPQKSVGLEQAFRQHGFYVAVPSFEELHDRTQPWFWRWISDSLREVDRQVVTHREVNLCGINDGATLALAVSAERPIVLDSLALVSPRLHFSASTLSRLRSHVRMPEQLAAWLASIRDHQRPAASAQLREVRRLSRHVEGSLGRIHTPTLIICECDEAAVVADVRDLQVHIGSSFLQVFVESNKQLIAHDHPSESTVLRVVEFFNDVARRRILAALPHS